MASIINKVKDKVEATLDRSSNNNQVDDPRSSNAGPHSSSLMNKGDPRVDSDRDHRNDPTSRVGGLGSTQEYNTIHGQTTAAGGIGGAEPGYGHTGGVGGVEPGYGHTAGHNVGHTVGHTGGHTAHTGGLAGQTMPTGGYGGAPNTYDNPHSANTGPHRSNLVNKMDPRVDSDNDNRNDPTSRVGGYGTQGENYGHTSGMTGTGTHGGVGGVSTSGYGGAPNTYDNPHSATTGPHRSNLVNKMDPRVDSDNDNRNDPTSRVGGYGTQGENYGHAGGMTGGHSGVGGAPTGGYGTQGEHYGHSTGMTGTHSGVGTTAGYGGGATTGAVGGHGLSHATPGSGNAPNTAGPHNSDIMNKMDPRVDADLDGSKTYGGNATYR